MDGVDTGSFLVAGFGVGVGPVVSATRELITIQ